MSGVTFAEVQHLIACGLELVGMGAVCLLAILLPLAFLGKVLELFPTCRDNG